MRPTRFLLIFVTLGLLELTGCASAPIKPTLVVADVFRQACERPDRSGVQTVGDLAAFSVRQEAALGSCDAKRARLVDLIDAGQPKAKKWWKF